MAENENGEEKTEKATSKKRKDARKKGNVLKSQDVSVVVSLFLCFALLRAMAPLIYVRLSEFMKKYVSMAGSGIGDVKYLGMDSFTRALITDCVSTFLICAGVLLLVSAVSAIISNGAQTKFLFTMESMKFSLEKLDPIKGMKKFFSMKALFQLAKNILKFVLLVAVVYSQLKDRLPEIVRLMQLEPSASMIYIAETVFSIVMVIGVVFIAVAVADYMFQHYTYEKDLMMTKQEVKDEFKQMEGDPKVKGKRRAIQQRMAMERMMKSVPQADVIIRNPTHFAVAVKYDPEKASAPVVLAKGKDMAALRIVDVAAEADVPSVENKPLARALYDKVEIGREIPPEFYQGVADVLWFVYNLKNKPIPGAVRPQDTSTPFGY